MRYLILVILAISLTGCAVNPLSGSINCERFSDELDHRRAQVQKYKKWSEDPYINSTNCLEFAGSWGCYDAHASLADEYQREINRYHKECVKPQVEEVEEPKEVPEMKQLPEL